MEAAGIQDGGSLLHRKDIDVMRVQRRMKVMAVHMNVVGHRRIGKASTALLK